MILLDTKSIYSDLRWFHAAAWDAVKRRERAKRTPWNFRGRQIRLA